jgi:hypothetical protein
VLQFPLQSSSVTFISKTIERYITINEHTSSCKLLVIIVRFSLKLSILNRFLNNSQVLTFKLSVHWELSCSMQKNKPTNTKKKKPMVVLANFRRRLKSIQTKIDLRNSIIPNTLYIPYLFKIFYQLDTCDNVYFCLQNWRDYSDMSQAVICYVIIASDVILICWVGTQLTQHVRQKGFSVIPVEFVNTLLP